MKVEYDKYYQTVNLFGEAYPELIDFFSSINEKGRLLDVGCGQGRDSIALAKLGYEVIGIDNSEVGIEQLNVIAENENLALKGIVCDIYSYPNYGEFEFVLLNSMFHFDKKGKEKESKLLERIIANLKVNSLITICIQKTGKKLEILKSIISQIENLEIVNQEELMYKFENKESSHSSETKFEMISIKKL